MPCGNESDRSRPHMSRKTLLTDSQGTPGPRGLPLRTTGTSDNGANNRRTGGVRSDRREAADLRAPPAQPRPKPQPQPQPRRTATGTREFAPPRHPQTAHPGAGSLMAQQKTASAEMWSLHRFFGSARRPLSAPGLSSGDDAENASRQTEMRCRSRSPSRPLRGSPRSATDPGVTREAGAETRPISAGEFPCMVMSGAVRVSHRRRRRVKTPAEPNDPPPRLNSSENSTTYAVEAFPTGALAPCSPSRGRAGGAPALSGRAEPRIDIWTRTPRRGPTAAVAVRTAGMPTGAVRSVRPPDTVSPRWGGCARFEEVDRWVGQTPSTALAVRK